METGVLMKLYYDVRQLPELSEVPINQRQRVWNLSLGKSLKDPLVLLALAIWGASIAYGLDIFGSLGLQGLSRLAGAVLCGFVAWMVLFPIVVWRVRPRIQRVAVSLNRTWGQARP
jgi:hypothetical protein